MKSCLGLLFAVFVFTLVVGGGSLIWYLSYSAEFSRDAPPPENAAAEPAKN